MTETGSNNRIVVGVDGSESSIDALRRAAALASALDVPLTAMTVWNYPPMVEYYPIDDWSPEEDAHRVLVDALQQAFPDGPPSSLTARVTQGPIARTLIVESKAASMLVLGSRGHGGFVGMLLGSVSAACAEHAHCPVLIVHSLETDARDESVVEDVATAAALTS